MKKSVKQSIKVMRHSCEHVLHQAMAELFPGLTRAMGPATNEGFYHDFDYKGKVSKDDFPKIEKRMREIIKADLPIIRQEISISDAKKLFKDNPYKQDWINQIARKGEKATVFWTGKPDKKGSDVDLCKGPHVKSTGQIGPFKLLSIAGAYWHGDEKNKMLTRIYGTCFASQKELDYYLWQLAEAKKRDHRILGKKLELFMFDDEVGKGLPLWLPKGAFIRNKIMEFAFHTYLENGYEPVSTPHIASNALWKHSGHLDFYAESMYNDFGIEKEQYRLKPMNCPFHVKMYNHRPRSYKELPIRWTEMGTVYRYEKSGVLHGLTRVRGFTQDDAHIICRPDQLHQELVKALKLTFYILKSFSFHSFEVNLSIRDPKNKGKFIGSDKDWQKAEESLKKAIQESDFKDYVLDVGGAVFYGPKIDIKVADSLGRKWQLSTIQVDFNLPGRFKMAYIDEKGKEKVPFMIHRALLGSLERFMGVFIEHCAGAFPIWLAPIQIEIIPINDQCLLYAEKIKSKLLDKNIRAKIDHRSETMQKKIKEAEEQKIPYMIIIGKREVEQGNISVRARGENDLGAMDLVEFIKKIKIEIEKKK